MPSSNTINLIRTKTSISPQLEMIEMSLRRSSYVLLSVVLLGSLLLMSFYVIFSQEHKTLEETKTQLSSQVSSEKQKEMAFIAIKERVAIVDKAQKSQRPWATMLDTIALFIPQTSLSGMSVDENSKTIVTIKNKSIEDVYMIHNALMEQVVKNTISNPQLLSLQFGTNGLVDMSLSFFPVF